MEFNRNSAALGVGHKIIGSAAILGVGVSIIVFSSRTMRGFGTADNFAPMALGGLFAFAGFFGLVQAWFMANKLGRRSSVQAVEESTGSFDADGAIERYLARKAAGEGEAPSASPSSNFSMDPSAPRPGGGFGRKAV